MLAILLALNKQNFAFFSCQSVESLERADRGKVCGTGLGGSFEVSAVTEIDCDAASDSGTTMDIARSLTAISTTLSLDKGEISEEGEGFAA